MHYIKVKGVDIPALGLGTGGLRGDSCRQVVEQALSMGYRAFDTAPVYENEPEIGQALAAAGLPRQQLFITTKLWPDDIAPPGGPMLDAVDLSLRRLGLDYVDLLLLHWPAQHRSMAELMAPLQAAIAEGKARLIGVCNFPSKLVRAALELAPLSCVQVEYHPYLSQRQVLTVVQENDMFLTAYCPLARGLVCGDMLLDDIGIRYGKSASQVSLRWLIQQRSVAVIPRSSRIDHLTSNLEIFDFALSPEEMADIHALARGRRLVSPQFGPAWDEG